MANVLITGGSGLIGNVITEKLKEKKHKVAWLSTSLENGDVEGVEIFRWNPVLNKVDDDLAGWSDYVIHLAGAGVADKRWTKERKKEILKSRTQSTDLLHEFFSGSDQKPKAVISASAIGYYGFKTSDEVFSENSGSGSDFLAEVTQEWESHTASFSRLNMRNVRLRIGIVLAREGGALKEMSKPPVLTPLGTGKQWLPWIHISDLAEMFIHAMENDEISGIYNAVGNNPVNNQELTKALSGACGKPYLGINAPAFAIKFVLGEMAGMVLEGTRVSNKKITKTGFRFEYNTIAEALKNLYD